jgi:threonine dehydratase
MTGAEVYCKYEHRQRTGSFKERGARNALELLTAAERARGVMAASAGNHAVALAWHGEKLGIPVTVVMPRFAPLAKVSNCRRFGATVELFGDNIAEARSRADEIVRESGAKYINGFDDHAIIAGQGTIGLEVAEQVPDADAVVVPIGGAGLVAGVGVALRHLMPRAKIVGVEPERAASFTAASAAGMPVPVEVAATLADGLAVPQVGANGFALARDLVDHTVLVNESDIALAILRLIELEKIVLEGAGAATLAAFISGGLTELAGKKVVLLFCGGNIDTPMLGRVLERALARDGRLDQFTATISDRPGGLARFAGLIAELGASVMDISHDRAFSSADINTVKVHCVVETRDAAHAQALRQQLGDEGFHINQGYDGNG